MLSDRWEAGEDVTANIERALLGNLILDSDLLAYAMKLRPHHFLSPARGAVFAIICDLVRRREPVTVLTVAHAIRATHEPPKGFPGWVTPLASLMDDCLPEASVTAKYADMIISDYVTRKGKA